jgi:hypothetical protein
LFHDILEDLFRMLDHGDIPAPPPLWHYKEWLGRNGVPDVRRVYSPVFLDGRVWDNLFENPELERCPMCFDEVSELPTPCGTYEFPFCSPQCPIGFDPVDGAPRAMLMVGRSVQERRRGTMTHWVPTPNPLDYML